MNFRVSEQAREEALGIAAWYDKQPGRYGNAFLDEFQTAMQAIRSAPRQQSPADDGRDGCEDREYFITRFKQRVVFTIDADGITVLSVVHSSRRPGYWYLHRRRPT